MIAFPNAKSLARQLVGRYLAFGLGSVFLCLVLSYVFRSGGGWNELGLLTALIPIGLLLYGCNPVWRLVVLHDRIAQQLERYSQSHNGGAGTLFPIPAASMLAEGWNSIVGQLDRNENYDAILNALSSHQATNQAGNEILILNTIPDGIVGCDASGRILETNQAFRAMVGKSDPNSYLGKRFSDFLLAAFPHLEERLQGGKLSTTASIELFDEKDVAAGAVRLTGCALLSAGDCGLAEVWVVRDITQQKLAELSRNQFVQSAAHELRTPLANIRAYADTLSESGPMPAEQRKEFFNVISSEATRLARFVDDLLSVDQMQVGAVTIHRHEVDLERLLHEITEKVQGQIRQKEIDFEIKLPPKIPKARLDKDKFAACLVNLLSNAVKYTPEKGTIRFLLETDGSLLQFHVEDTGIGIAADELPRISERFFRSQDTRVQKVSGSGLGLAFAQEVARLHGGKITVKSEYNKGSRFTLSIPPNV